MARQSASVQVLVASDSSVWRDEVAERLAAEGYLASAHLARCDESVVGRELDLAVIDVVAGGALELIAELRRRSDLPILAVSPERYPEVAVLEVFAAGADQLVSRDVPHELAARVRALLRRSPPIRPDDHEALPGAVGSIHLDPAEGVATIEGIRVALTPREVEVLDALIRRPGCVITRDHLAGPGRSARADRGLDSLMRGIRNKLEAAEGRRRIVTVRGLGFRLRTDAELAASAGEPHH